MTEPERGKKGKKKRQPIGKRPGPRGWPGRGGGMSTYLQAPDEWRGTTVQVCGLWPFTSGTGSPMVGVPIGRNLMSGATMCCDPISWFMRAKLISNPSMFVLGKPGLGKALDVDTEIPTPQGVRRMGDLQPGDVVFDGNGQPTPVVAVSEVMTDRECWELTFSTGERIVADAEHLWVTETAWVPAGVSRIREPSGPAQVVTTAEVAATLHGDHGPNHRVRMMPGLRLPAVDLPLDPYVLGASLGGRKSSPGDDFLPSHVPTPYLRSSERQRRDLLSGLVDSCGTVSTDIGEVRLLMRSERLAAVVHELVASLGYQPELTIDGCSCTVSFTWGTPSYRHIVAARLTRSRPVRCIQVANADGLYLVGRSFIATHNSTITRRMALGLAGYGIQPLVLGDLKPDYKDLIEALGGQVIQLGRGRGHLNVLDPGESREAALRLTGSARQAIQADAHGRRQTMVSALISIMRAQPPTDREETIIDEALKVLDDRHRGTPVLRDLLQVIKDAPDSVRDVALDRGDIERYRQITEGLEASLIGLVGGGRLGEIFSEHTDNPMQMDRPVVFDVSNIDDSEMNLQAAVLLACWSYGFGAVAVAQALADAGLEPRRHYFVILDELWRVLRAGRGLVDRVDALTRLNRQRGVGMAMISHTMSDLQALAHEEDRMKARGFVERSGMAILGGLPRAEMHQLTSVVPMSQEEQDMLIGWQDPPAWDPATGEEAAPPGRGNFLIKVGGRPGIPVHVDLTSVERDINDTNKLWKTGSEGQPVQVALAPDGSEEVINELTLDDPALLPPPDPSTRRYRDAV
jgi:hypothetical protein